jgi:TFIIF-interacting CTD phosphatase-like protein
MKFFRNLFSKTSQKTKSVSSLSLNSDHTNIANTTIIKPANNTSLQESSELSQSFSKLINNLQNKNLIKKVENNFNDFSSNKSMLRTIVDESPLQEDIFRHIIRKAVSKIPEKPEDKINKISLFLPLDDILLYSYIPDENFGMTEIPKHKDYDFRLELPEYKTFAYVFLRENFCEFLEFINKNFEPILYSTAEKTYVDKLMAVVDPGNVFAIKLYQQDCHLYKDASQNYLEYLKDINLFTNRNLKKKILLDTSAFNYLLSPDNGNFFIYFILKID